MDLHFYTRNELADLFHVHESTVDRWAKNGTLNPVRIGSRTLFSKDDVEELIEQGKETAA